MKKLLTCFSLLIFCAACGPLTTQYEMTPTEEKQANPKATQALLTVTYTQKAPPTVFLTPTENFPAQIGALKLKLQSIEASSTVEAIEGQKRDATATVQRGYDNGTATATAAIGNKKATLTAAVLQAVEAKAVQTQSAAATATVQYPITQKLQTEADWAWVWQIIYVCGAIVIIMAVVYAIGVISYAVATYIHELRVIKRQEHAYLSEPVVTQEPPAPSPAKGLTVKIDDRDPYGYGAVNFGLLPITKDDLLRVSELMVAGARYTQAQMTGAGKPLVKDKNFDSFGNFMCKYSIAKKLPTGHYFIVHPEFFEQVLDRQ